MSNPAPTSMPQLVIWGHKQGSGYVCTGKDSMNPFLAPEPVKVAGTTIEPNTETDLCGHFCRPLTYLGLIQDSEFKAMIFYIGSSETLFSQHYFQVVYWITETRIFEIFGPGSGRDFNYVKGRWK